jgi:tyrosyl-tRNA synthetase
MKNLTLREELEARGLLYQISNDAFFDVYDKGGHTFYIGMDPSADSLTIGNFAMFMTCLQFMKRWNKLIFIVGGETWMIGDPGGRETERSLQTMEQFEKNFESVHEQVKFLLANVLEISGYKCEFIIKNNHDFYVDMSFSSFLRDVGKHITINNMIKKETVAKRIEDPDRSISYTEFSYMLIQGYDFVRLYEDFDCKLQICWSDQWGNGVTGIELIGKMLGKDDAYVMTSPLILDSTGRKFGKSEGNAIRLKAEKNSPYFVYQYFMNTADGDVARFLKVYSLLSLEEIDRIQHDHDQHPELREGQKALAYLVCQIIFGTKAAEEAKKVSEFMFAEDKVELLKNLDNQMKQVIAKEVGSSSVTGEVSILDVLVDSWLCESRGDAKKLIEQGAISVDGEAINDIRFIISDTNVLIQKGKKQMRIIL